ncbi:MAG TPA: N-formylglutamate amidohydrolase [Stellaceae bacterium]
MPLLGSNDPPPVEEISGRAPVVLVCDHASNRVPAMLAGLGLRPDELDRHIGWDIGAAAVTRKLAPALGVSALLCGYSRLVIDCNRAPSDPSSIPTESDGIAIPGNANLCSPGRAARRAAIFDPYHAAVARRLAAVAGVPALISVHSFTPVMNGVARPWHVGILWDGDGRIAAPLLAALGAEAHLTVGDNLPYSAREPVGYTVSHHAHGKGLPHVAIELRQDLITDAAGATEWAARLARVLAPILARAEIYRVERPAR